MKKKKPRKQLDKYARLTGIAFQMAATIFIGAYIGLKLDEKYPNKNNLYSAIFSLVFVLIALYSAVKQVTNISNNNE